jgi:hypothetical protein
LSLDKSNSYIKSNPNPVYTEEEKPKVNFLKYGISAIAIIVIGISLISFLTQGVLLVFDKNNKEDQIINIVKTDQDQVNDQLKNFYVRADLNRDIFATTTDEVATSTPATTTVAAVEEDISKYFNVNIPGVSRIGYDESLGNQFLTDNINKYSDKTLVIGERGSSDEMNPGGSDNGDESLVDKYELVSKAVLPVLNSKAYLLADLDTGEIILEKNSETVHPIASVTKLMTSVVVTEKLNMQDIAIVSKDATNAYGTQGGLFLGEKIRLADLVFPLLMESSNDAAEVFADHFGHQAFMDEMNRKAVELGMVDTYYNDPSGLDPKNTSSPKDLLRLVRYIWDNDPTIFDTTRVKQFSIKGHTWLNRNPQLPLSGYIGGKNGYIYQSRQTSASIFEIPTAKGGMRKVVIIILKSETKDADVVKLINFMKKYVVYTP